MCLFSFDAYTDIILGNELALLHSLKVKTRSFPSIKIHLNSLSAALY